MLTSDMEASWTQRMKEQPRLLLPNTACWSSTRISMPASQGAQANSKSGVWMSLRTSSATWARSLLMSG